MQHLILYQSSKIYFNKMTYIKNIYHPKSPPYIKILLVLIFILQKVSSTTNHFNILQSTNKPQQQQICNIESTIPSHLYPIYLENGHELIGELVCASGQANMDVYIYKGINISVPMKIGQLVSNYTSQQICNESIIFLPPQTNTYYIKILGKDKDASRFYSYRLKLQEKFMSNTVKNFAYSGSFLKFQPQYNAYAIFNKHTYVCQYYYTLEYWPPAGNITYIHVDSESNILGYAESELDGKKISINLNIETSENMYIYVRYLQIQNITNQIPTRYAIKLKRIINDPEQCQKNCRSRGQDWKSQLFQCVSPKTPYKSTSINIPVIIGTTFLTFISIILILYKLKQFRDSQKSRLHSQHNTHNIHNESKTDIQVQSLCSICLQSDCNINLKCNHMFHEKCIKQWLKKDQKCPNCRDFISKIEIRD